MIAPSYRADAVILEVPAGAASVRVTALAVETQEGTIVQASRLSAYLSESAFQEIATTPQIRVFHVAGTLPLVHGALPTSDESGPASGGRLEFRSEGAQTVEVAVPFLNGWSGNAPVSEFSGRLRVEARAQALTQLQYAPSLFLPGLLLALLGLCAGALTLARPAIVGGLLKTRRDEGK